MPKTREIIGGSYDGAKLLFHNGVPLPRCAIAGWVCHEIYIARPVLRGDKVTFARHPDGYRQEHPQ